MRRGQWVGEEVETRVVEGWVVQHVKWVWSHDGSGRRNETGCLHIHFDHIIFILIVRYLHVITSPRGHAPSSCGHAPSPCSCVPLTTSFVVRYRLHLQGFEAHHNWRLVSRYLLHFQFIGWPGRRGHSIRGRGLGIRDVGRCSCHTHSTISEQRLQSQGRVESVVWVCIVRRGGRRGKNWRRRWWFVLIGTDVLYPPTT